MKKIVLALAAAALVSAPALAAAHKAKAKKFADRYEASAVQKSEATPKASANNAGKFEIEPNFGLTFFSPKDLNDLIRDNNDALQGRGFKSFSAPQFGTSAAFGLGVMYKVHRDIGLGLAWNHMGSTSEGSASNGGTTLQAAYGISANLLMLDSKITFARLADEKLDLYAGPQIGMGFYGANQEFSGTAVGTTSEITASANGFVFGATAGARYWFLKNLSAGMYTGYRSAKSGNLKVDSVKNAGATAVGQELDNGGKKLRLDASSFMIGTGLTWAI